MMSWQAEVLMLSLRLGIIELLLRRQTNKSGLSAVDNLCLEVFSSKIHQQHEQTLLITSLHEYVSLQHWSLLHQGKSESPCQLLLCCYFSGFVLVNQEKLPTTSIAHYCLNQPTLSKRTPQQVPVTMTHYHFHYVHHHHTITIGTAKWSPRGTSSKARTAGKHCPHGARTYSLSFSYERSHGNILCTVVML